MMLGLTIKQLIQKDFLMYKYKPLSKPVTTLSVKKVYKKGTLLGTCSDIDVAIFKYFNKKGFPLYVVVNDEAVEKDSAKAYSSIALYWQMFEDSTTWDEVQIWDDVGRLAALTRKTYKVLKSS